MRGGVFAEFFAFEVSLLVSGEQLVPVGGGGYTLPRKRLSARKLVDREEERERDVILHCQSTSRSSVYQHPLSSLSLYQSMPLAAFSSK